MNILTQIVVKIIKEQELVIGPVAWSEARKVFGLQINESNQEKHISIDENNAKEIIDKLVKQYEKLFGQASNEVCKEAVKSLINKLPSIEVPISLKEDI